MIHYERRLTQLDEKMGPALRVAYRDVGKGRQHACMDVGSSATQGAVAEGCGSFDWYFFSGISNTQLELTGPEKIMKSESYVS